MAENYYLNHTATQIDAILTKVDGIAAGANVNVQADWDQTTTTADDYIKNKPTIPDAQIQSDWNQTNTESKDFIKNKPTIPEAQVNSDWEASSGVAQILNKPTIPDAQIQSDWEQTNTESKDFIKNKPTIPAAQVNSDWSAASGVAQILNKPTLGTAAAKDYTTAVLGLSNDLVTSSAVSTAISTKADLVDGKVPSAQLPSYVDDSIEGYYYEGAFYEDSSHTTAITGESGKIYIDLTANKSYRWTGTVYVRIDECPAFGETQGTIYEGNKGKANADNIGSMSSLTTTEKGSLVGAINEVKGSLGTAAAKGVDASPTASSTNLVESGGVVTALKSECMYLGAALLISNGSDLDDLKTIGTYAKNDNADTIAHRPENETTAFRVYVGYDGNSSGNLEQIYNPYRSEKEWHRWTTSSTTWSDWVLVNDNLAAKADKATTYTKTEIDNMIGDINAVLEEVL